MQAAQAARKTYTLGGELLSSQTGQDIEETPTHGCSCTGRVELGASDSSGTARKCSSPFFSVTHNGLALSAAADGGDDRRESLTIPRPNLSRWTSWPVKGLEMVGQSKLIFVNKRKNPVWVKGIVVRSGGR